VSLKETINNDLKTALLGGNRFRGEVLRGLKAAVLNEEVAKGLREAGLDDTAIEQVIAREVKKRNESANIYDGAGRPELSENERAEAAILSEYLPAQVSEEDIQTAIDEAIKQMDAKGMAAMGQLIGAVKSKFGNSADGSIIARLVKNTLQ